MEALIKGLMPNSKYALQIRSGTIWSPVFRFDTVGNTTPPSTPAAPTFFANQQSIMVQHSLNKADGSNLEQDVSVLEAYISSNNFVTQQKIGEIAVANPESDISAIGSFPFASKNNISYRVRVRAVNSSGLRSEPSASSAASTIPLLEHIVATDATIQSVSANKITAGSGILNNIQVKSRLTIASGGSIQSANFVQGSSGFRLDPSFLEVNSGIFRGSMQVGAKFSVDTLGNLTASNVNLQGTITGSTFRTASSGARVELNQSVRERIRFYNNYNNMVGTIGLGNTNSGNIIISSDGAVRFLSNSLTSRVSIDAAGVALAGSEVPIHATASHITDLIAEFASRSGTGKHLWMAFGDPSYSTSTSYNHPYIYNSRAGIKFLNSTDTVQIRNGLSDSAYGTLRAGVVSYNTLSQASDPNLKENISLFELSGVELVKNTPVYRFNYKGESSQNIGWMATEAPDSSVQGGGEGLSINTSNMLAIVWKAVQELNERIIALEGA